MFSISEEIIRAFKRRIFPYIDGIKVDEESDEESDEELDENKFFEYIENESKVLTIICLQYILILYHLLFWKKNYFKQKIKLKMINM